jgi:hypothetical protein
VPRHPFALLVALIAAATLSATALASGTSKAKTGHYAGKTSESGTVTLKVVKHGKRIAGFTATDGYNDVCQFSGGVGGIPTFTVRVPSMKTKKNGSFSATVAATLGGFSGMFKVRGRVTGSKARGTVTKVGDTCGSSAANPTAADYLETFTATRT